MKLRTGRSGSAFLGCTAYPACRNTVPVKVAGGKAEARPDVPTGEELSRLRKAPRHQARPLRRLRRLLGVAGLPVPAAEARDDDRRDLPGVPDGGDPRPARAIRPVLRLLELSRPARRTSGRAPSRRRVPPAARRTSSSATGRRAPSSSASGKGAASTLRRGDLDLFAPVTKIPDGALAAAAEAAAAAAVPAPERSAPPKRAEGHGREIAEEERLIPDEHESPRPPRRRAGLPGLRPPPREPHARVANGDPPEVLAEELRRDRRRPEGRPPAQRSFPAGLHLLGDGLRRREARHREPRLLHGVERRGTLPLRPRGAPSRAAPPRILPDGFPERRVGLEGDGRRPPALRDVLASG